MKLNFKDYDNKMDIHQDIGVLPCGSNVGQNWEIVSIGLKSKEPGLKQYKNLNKSI